MYEYDVVNLNLSQIANSGQCFRWIKTDNGYEIPFRDDTIVISQNGSILTSNVDITDYLDLNTDYGEIIKAIPQDDEYLISAAREFSGVRILNQDLWVTKLLQ